MPGGPSRGPPPRAGDGGGSAGDGAREAGSIPKPRSVARAGPTAGLGQNGSEHVLDMDLSARPGSAPGLGTDRRRDTMGAAGDLEGQVSPVTHGHCDLRPCDRRAGAGHGPLYVEVDPPLEDAEAPRQSEMALIAAPGPRRGRAADATACSWASSRNRSQTATTADVGGRLGKRTPTNGHVRSSSTASCQLSANDVYVNRISEADGRRAGRATIRGHGMATCCRQAMVIKAP